VKRKKDKRKGEETGGEGRRERNVKGGKRKKKGG